MHVREMKTFIKISKQYKQIRWLFCLKKKKILSMDQKSTKGQNCEMSHMCRIWKLIRQRVRQFLEKQFNQNKN